MLLHCGRARSFLEGLSYEQFYGDAKTQAACYASLLIVGEAASKVPQSFRAEHPEIPWSRLAKNRGRMIHGYDSIRWEIVWRMIKTELPALEKDLQKLLDSLPDEPQVP